MASFVLPFEGPEVDLLEKLRELRRLAETNPGLRGEVRSLEEMTEKVARDLFGGLSRIQKVQLSRHAMRPYTLDYVSRLMTEWVELAGDRRFAEDASIVGGLARFDGRSVVIIGHQKGRNTKENVKRNFGMPHPEGYRKAIRLFEMAERFRLPILTFIDTPGAYPGIGAEERGQSEAIGASIAALSRATVPVIATVIGEGGSGGAVALGVANRVLMLEFGCYSVISPEGCAAILWKDGGRAAEAAERMRVTAPDLLGFGVVDAVVDEPPGGAHQDHDGAALRVGAAIRASLAELSRMTPSELAEDRYAKFRKMGMFTGLRRSSVEIPVAFQNSRGAELPLRSVRKAPASQRDAGYTAPVAAWISPAPAPPIAAQRGPALARSSVGCPPHGGVRAVRAGRPCAARRRGAGGTRTGRAIGDRPRRSVREG